MERMPRVSRIEYLLSFLEGVQRQLKVKELAEMLGKCKLSFEEQKYAALGRGKPLSRKMMVAKSLVSECASLAKKLGLLNKGKKSLTQVGIELLNLSFDKRREKIARLYVNSFEYVKEILIKMNSTDNKEFLLPDYRHGKFKKFNDYIARYGLLIDVLSFIAVRDILWQFGYVNWFQFKKNKEYWFKVYLTAQVSDSQLPTYSLTFTYNSTRFYVKMNETSMSDFLDVLWSEYMRQTNDVELIPILYSELRNNVCYKLRISDGVFDGMLEKAIAEKDAPFRIIWSSGAVPYERDTLSLLKNLPPRSYSGQYMTYLLIGSRK